MGYILAADIGGTNTRMGIASAQDPSKIQHYKHIKTSSIKRIEVALLEFLHDSQIPAESIDECIMACAGTVHNNKCRLTNANLAISSRSIRMALGIERVHLINDMQACAERIVEHMPLLEEGKVIQKVQGAKSILLQDNYADRIEYQDKGMIMLIQAGTGFGLSTMLTSKNRSFLLPSESDHFPFSPYTQEEYEYYDYLRKKDSLATVGRVLRSKGLYEYASFIGCKASSPQEVSLSYDEDMRAREAVHFYLKAHARYVAHFCNVFLPYRGVFITGNAIITNLKGILKSDYIGVLKSHLKIESLQKIPIYIVEEHNMNLKGALSLGKSRSESKQKIMLME